MSDEAAQDSAPGAGFERAYRELQETIAVLEQGGLTLQESIQTFERGMDLASRCAAILDQAELRVTRVVDAQQIGPNEPAF